MIVEDGASGNVETSFWPYGRGFGIQTAADGQIEADFSLSGHTSRSVISEAAANRSRRDKGTLICTGGSVVGQRGWQMFFDQIHYDIYSTLPAVLIAAGIRN